MYWLNSAYYAWFWLGVWVLYYSKFGGFAAVGILETVMIVSTILFEIPTGALGDLLGKRKTLFLAYLFSGISNLWMAVAPNLLHMVLSLVLMNFGGALRSGTFEATVYDSLKDKGAEDKYNNVLANMTAGRLVTLATTGIIGGFLYKMNNSLPFILCGIVILAGTILTLMLEEPSIDSEKFTLKNYIKQNFRGFKQLFQNSYTSLLTLALLSVGSITLIMHEGINDILSVEFGFTEVQLGILSAVLCYAGAGASVVAGKIGNRMKNGSVYLISIIMYALSLIASPYVGLITGGITILARNIISPILENQESGILNKQIESKNRATTLSSFSMLKGLPYALLIFPISASADKYPVQLVAFYIGIIMLGSVILTGWTFSVRRNASLD